MEKVWRWRELSLPHLHVLHPGTTSWHCRMITAHNFGRFDSNHEIYAHLVCVCAVPWHWSHPQPEHSCWGRDCLHAYCTLVSQSLVLYHVIYPLMQRSTSQTLLRDVRTILGNVLMRLLHVWHLTYMYVPVLCRSAKCTLNQICKSFVLRQFGAIGFVIHHSLTRHAKIELMSCLVATAH